MIALCLVLLSFQFLSGQPVVLCDGNDKQANSYMLHVMIDQLNKPFGFFIGRELVIWATPVTRFSMASVKDKHKHSTSNYTAFFAFDQGRASK